MKNIKKQIKEQTKKFHKKEFSVLQVTFITILSIIISLLAGYFISHIQKYDKYQLEILKNYDLINKNYYGQVNKEKLTLGAINGMLSALGDAHSGFISTNTNSTLYIYLTGQYEGIGVQVSNDENGNIIILNVLDDSPAKVAGLEEGDIIKKIDDLDLTNKEVNELTKYVKENDNTAYKLTIERNNEIKEYVLEKKLIRLKSVSSKIINNNNKKIGYIYIAIFSQTTPSQFEKALEELEREKVDGIIIDVRSNSGGYLTSAVNIISNFVDDKTVIYQTEQNNKKLKFKSIGSKTKKYPIVILQDSNSASASELLSSALKETYDAKVVGMTSYGKGTIQEILETSSGEKYKITTKKWLTAKGNQIDGKGIKPDYEVQIQDKYFESPSDETDNQLQKALEVITK